MLEIIIKERGKARAIVPILQMRKVMMKVPSEYQSQKTSETRPSYSTSRFTIPESWPQALPTLPADSARCFTLKPGQAARWRLGSCSNFWPLAQPRPGPRQTSRPPHACWIPSHPWSRGPAQGWADSRASSLLPVLLILAA